jgi:hypothetical protein
MLSERDLATLTRGHCPACGLRGFVIGPQALPAINIECANTACAARYNVAFFSGQAIMGHELDGGAPWPSAAIPRVMTEEEVVKHVVALLPEDKSQGLLILDAARRLVERFKR